MDVSSLNVPDQVHLRTIAQQYGAKNFYGIKFLGRTQQRYIEIYPRDSIIDKFVTEGVQYEDQKVRLLPCKAIAGAGKVIQISLLDIPYISDDKELEKGLEKALGRFGTILDIGFNHESLDGWFMGSGYAVIQQDETSEYPELHHTIPWGDNGEYCHATFPDMPTWCRYCHEEGHTKFGCKKALASILCYACDKYGHKQVDCPEAQYGTLKANPYKKSRKTPKNQERAPTPQPSEELMKSMYAPGGKKDKQAKEVSMERVEPQDNKNTILDDCFNNDSSGDEDFTLSSEEEESDEEMGSVTSECSPTFLIEDANMSEPEDKPKSEALPKKQENTVAHQVILNDGCSASAGKSPHNLTNNQ
jgi:hypothetical protein